MWVRARALKSRWVSFFRIWTLHRTVRDAHPPVWCVCTGNTKRFEKSASQNFVCSLFQACLVIVFPATFGRAQICCSFICPCCVCTGDIISCLKKALLTFSNILFWCIFLRCSETSLVLFMEDYFSSVIKALMWAISYGIQMIVETLGPYPKLYYWKWTKHKCVF